MALDDLLKGLAVFSDGMKQYAVSTALNDANEQLLQLNQGEGDRAAKNQIAQNLTMRLGMAGADAAHIQTIAGQLVPSQGAQYEAGVNADLQQKSQQFQHDEGRLHAQDALNLEAVKLKAKKADTAKAMSGLSKEFYDQNKKQLDEVDKMKGIQDLLQKNPKSFVASNLAQMSYVKEAMGRANWNEVDMANPSKAKKVALVRAMGIELTNEDLSDNGKFFQKITGEAINRMGTDLAAKAQGYAQMRASFNPAFDADEIHRGLLKGYIYPRFGNPAAQVSQKQQQQAAADDQVAQAQAFLNSPAGKKLDPIKRQKVLDGINHLKTKGPAAAAPQPPAAASPPPTPGASNDTTAEPPAWYQANNTKYEPDADLLNSAGSGLVNSIFSAGE